MPDNLARKLFDGMSPHERLVQWLEEELRRATHTTPPDLAEIGRLTMAIQECRRGWLREKMT